MALFKFPSLTFLANVMCTDLSNGVLRLPLENVSILGILFVLIVCKLGQSKLLFCRHNLTNFGRSSSTRHSISWKMIDTFSSLSLNISSSMFSQLHNLSNLSFPRFLEEEIENKILRVLQWAMERCTKF